MYRVNNLLFVHAIFACIFGVKLKNFPGATPPNPPFFLGGCAPQTPCSVIWKTPFKIPGYATVNNINKLQHAQVNRLLGTGPNQYSS